MFANTHNWETCGIKSPKATHGQPTMQYPIYQHYNINISSPQSWMGSRSRFFFSGSSNLLFCFRPCTISRCQGLVFL